MNTEAVIGLMQVGLLVTIAYRMGAFTVSITVLKGRVDALTERVRVLGQKVYVLTGKGN